MQHLMKRRLIPPALRRARRTGGKNGAPSGNQNAFKHGKYTRARRALWADIRAHIRRSRALIAAYLHPASEGGARDATPSLPS